VWEIESKAGVLMTLNQVATQDEYKFSKNKNKSSLMFFFTKTL